MIKRLQDAVTDLLARVETTDRDVTHTLECWQRHAVCLALAVDQVIYSADPAAAVASLLADADAEAAP